MAGRNQNHLDPRDSDTMTTLLWLALIALVIAVGIATQHWINRR